MLEDCFKGAHRICFIQQFINNKLTKRDRNGICLASFASYLIPHSCWLHIYLPTHSTANNIIKPEIWFLFAWNKRKSQLLYNKKSQILLCNASFVCARSLKQWRYIIQFFEEMKRARHTNKREKKTIERRLFELNQVINTLLALNISRLCVFADTELKNEAHTHRIISSE